MAACEMEPDAVLFANIIEELATLKQKACHKEINEPINTKLISFKAKYSLNYVDFDTGKKAIVQGLEEVVGEMCFDDRSYLLIVSGEVEVNANGFDCSDEHVDVTEGLTENFTIRGEVGGPTFNNKVEIASDLVVKAGPTSGSFVQFITGKSQLQSVSCMSTTQRVKTETLSPIKLKDARYFVSIFVQSIKKLKSKLNDETFRDFPLPWVLIKCKNDDPQRISWLCCKMENTVKAKDEKGFLKSFIITEEKAVIDLDAKLAKTIKMDVVDEKHIYFARYDLLNSVERKCDDVGIGRSMLMLELSWQEDTAPNQPPPSAADALAKFKVIPSDASSPMSSVYMELIQLDNIVHGIADADNAVWLDLQEDEKNQKGIFDMLPEFIEGLKTVKYAESILADKKESRDEEKSAKLPSYILDSFQRKDHDFTDELWELLKFASTFDEVLQSLDHIFAAICTCEVQPVFNSENKTDLANWVRQFYRASNQNEGRDLLKEKLNAVLEDKTNALHLVANIGLEKHKQDYISFFIKEELATFGQLEPILKDDASMAKRMLTMWKLHHSLELVAVAIAYLHLPVDYVRMILKASLDYYKNCEDLSLIPIFSISIPAVSSAAGPVIDRCLAHKPVLWKCSASEVSQTNGKNLLKMFISSEDADISFDVDPTKDDFTETFHMHKVVIVSESSVRVY